MAVYRKIVLVFGNCEDVVDNAEEVFVNYEDVSGVV